MEKQLLELKLSLQEERNKNESLQHIIENLRQEKLEQSRVIQSYQDEIGSLEKSLDDSIDIIDLLKVKIEENKQSYEKNENDYREETLYWKNKYIVLEKQHHNILDYMKRRKMTPTAAHHPHKSHYSNIDEMDMSLDMLALQNRTNLRYVVEKMMEQLVTLERNNVQLQPLLQEIEESNIASDPYNYYNTKRKSSRNRHNNANSTNTTNNNNHGRNSSPINTNTTTTTASSVSYIYGSPSKRFPISETTISDSDTDEDNSDEYNYCISGSSKSNMYTSDSDKSNTTTTTTTTTVTDGINSTTTVNDDINVEEEIEVDVVCNDITNMIYKKEQQQQATTIE